MSADVLAAQLDALAMDFEGEALDADRRRYTDLRRAAGQVRRCAQAVLDGTVSYAVGLAWLDAGMITLARYRKAFS